MTKLLIATCNRGKIAEIREALADLAEKNGVSHRGAALRQARDILLREFLS